MSRLYFDEDAEYCNPLKSHYEQMREEGITEKTVYEAEIMIGEPFYFCSFFGEVGEVGEGCGKDCSEYKPRNGKNGRCKFSKNCYTPNDKFKILKI